MEIAFKINSDDEKKRGSTLYPKILISIWGFCSIIPMFHFFYYLTDLENLWRLEMGLCTILGPFVAIYEAIFFLGEPFPLNPITESILGIVLLFLIIASVKIKNRWLRIIGIIALLIWCLIGCSASMRFVT